MLRELDLNEMKRVTGGTCPDRFTEEECEEIKELIRNEGTVGIPNPAPRTVPGIPTSLPPPQPNIPEAPEICGFDDRGLPIYCGQSIGF